MTAIDDGVRTVLHGDISNSGEMTIDLARPYVVRVGLVGASAMLFHRWQSDSVEAKARAAKGSEAKKTDDIASYVWRDEEGYLGLPGEYVRGSICGPNGAAKFRKDPRSPRKSALDLFKSGVVSLTDVGRLHNSAGEPLQHWEFEDRRRVTVQRNGITRTRPGLHAGWHAEVELQVLLGEYILPAFLREVLIDAGRLVGVADFRPTFGRFFIDSFLLVED